MIPVVQTKVSVANTKGKTIVYGNCLAACIASMLEVPITEVPNVEVFYTLPDGDDYYWDVLEKFLKHRDYELSTDDRFKVFHDLNFGIEKGKRLEYIEQCRNKYYLVSGKSPRGLSHITIWKNGKLKHDPHPTKEGLVTFTTFQTLEKINKL